MAKVKNLPQIEELELDDFFYVVDNSEGSNGGRKISKANLESTLNVVAVNHGISHVEGGLDPIPNATLLVGGLESAADKTKLTGIEANATADQTDVEIKTAYESNTNTNAFTDAEKTKLTGIEALATADQTGAEIKSLYEVQPAAYTDAKDTKLSGIEALATADQTDVEIKTAYENNTNTNAFTDAEKTKLTGIEALADVTDAANVAASGATMDADTSLVGNGYFLDEDNMVSDDATKVASQQSIRAYVDNAVVSVKAYKGGYNAGTNTPDLDTTPIGGIVSGHVYDVTVSGNFFTELVEVGDTLTARIDSPTVLTDWVITQTNLNPSSIKTQYESNTNTNAFTDAEKTKLTGIEALATADQTDVEIKTAYENNTNTNAFTDAEKTNLGNQSGTNTGDEVSSTESVQGIIEIATQTEVTTGTDDIRAITPLKLATRLATIGSVVEKGASFTLSDADHNTTIVMTSASAQIITVNSGLKLNFACTIFQQGVGDVTFLAGTVASLVNPDGFFKLEKRYVEVSVKRMDTTSDTIAVQGRLIP